jgi:hypothetical protein
MLKQKAVERAVAAAMQMTHGYRVLVVRPSGRTGWTINFSSSGRFRTINIQVDGDTTETDAQRLIEKKLDA